MTLFHTQFPRTCRRPRRGFSYLSIICLLGTTSTGLWLLLGSAKDHPGSAPAVAQAMPAAMTAPGSAVKPEYSNIKDIQVGQRVVTPQTDPRGKLPTNVNPTTWKKLSLRLLNHWPDGTIDEMRVQTLQAPSWILEHGTRVGSKVPIPLDLTEMGIPQQPAEVVAIERCPIVQDGPGRVVLTTVSHLNNFLFDLKVQGERGPPVSVEVTGWHKLYSESRGWVSVCELRTGEQLRGRRSPLIVTSLTRHAGTNRVYNMTVEAEHVYYVAAIGVLAHNTQCVAPVTMDQAIDRAVAHAGEDANVVLTKGGNVQLIGEATKDATGKTVRNIARLDVNPADPHVQALGPHLNEEVQINGVSQPGDPHTPIDPATVKPGDHG